MASEQAGEVEAGEAEAEQSGGADFEGLKPQVDQALFGDGPPAHAQWNGDRIEGFIRELHASLLREGRATGEPVAANLSASG